jgi:hypothetical protein
MTRTKVLLVALGIIALGALQLAHSYGSTDRSAGVRTASGMIALMSGVAVAIYAMTLRRHP